MTNTLTPLMQKAITFAIEKHTGQEYNGGPFFSHPWETAQVLRQLTQDENLICAAYLHDTLEDTDTSYEELEREFNTDIASLVREVTKSESNTFPHLTTQRGVMLKFADRLTNVSHMDEWDEERKQRYLFVKSKFWQ